MVDNVVIKGKDRTSGEYKKVTTTNDKLDTTSTILNALITEEYDYISLSYTGSDLTGVVYKLGGAGGTTVATLVLTYTASVLQTVTKT